MYSADTLSWAGPVTQIVTAGIAALAFWKARQVDKDNTSAALVEAESHARESLAKRYDQEITRCTKECDELREDLESERKLRRELERKVDDQSRQLEIQARHINRLEAGSD